MSSGSMGLRKFKVVSVTYTIATEESDMHAIRDRSQDDKEDFGIQNGMAVAVRRW